MKIKRDKDKEQTPVSSELCHMWIWIKHQNLNLRSAPGIHTNYEKCVNRVKARCEKADSDSENILLISTFQDLLEPV